MITKAIKILFNSLVLAMAVWLIGVLTFQPVLPSMLVSQYEVIKEYEATEDQFTLRTLSVCHEVVYKTSRWFGDGTINDPFRRKVYSKPAPSNYCRRKTNE